jgi:hypothetical protein
MNDLVNLIQSIENVNHELMYENTFIRDEMSNCKDNILKLIEENSKLHKELKGVTIHDIITELKQNQNSKNSSSNNNTKE